MPGKPASASPPLDEPTVPQEPLRPKADQEGPETVSPTGQATGDSPARQAQSGPYLTTAQGARLYDTNHSLKAGPRGPVLLQDQHLREKITHFDHERVPERVVHARGAATHGVFRGYGTAAQISKAAFLAKDVETPVFVRFSTVLGSRGSADTARGAAASLRSSTPKRASSTWFHRRDLADAIEAGAFPQWELGVQTFPDNPEQMFEGIDLLDPTKIVPEELAPVQPSA